MSGGAAGRDAAPAAAAELFISYAREDRDRAERLASALSAAGLTVWWDRQITGGQDFADVIAERLDAARWVLVLWSAASVASNFVRDESARARDAGKLLPLRIDDVKPPLGFGTIHTLDLLDWNGERDDPGWLELLATVRRAPGQVSAPRRLPQRATGRRWGRPALLALLLAALIGAGGYGWNSWREQQALEQFQQGLSAHFARDRNLQAARNSYLSALRINPRLGRAHYYLAHVYALLTLPRDARTQFEAALQFGGDLDEGQRDDARVQLAALNIEGEPAPVARDAAAPQPGSASTPRPGGDDGATPGSPALAAARRLPRLAPSPEQRQIVEAQVDALFAPLAQTRLSAATAIALDPALVSDALPAAVERALAGLREVPPSEAAVAGATDTLQLLLSASPATLAAHRDAALELLDSVQSLGEHQRATAAKVRALIDQAPAAAQPLVYIQIASEAQDRLARTLAERIRAAGYEVPAIEDVGRRAPSRSEVRVQGASVQGWGRWLAKIVAEASGEPVRVSTLRGARPSVDAFEIWLDKDLCVAPGRRVPGC